MRDSEFIIISFGRRLTHTLSRRKDLMTEHQPLPTVPSLSLLASLFPLLSPFLPSLSSLPPSSRLGVLAAITGDKLRAKECTDAPSGQHHKVHESIHGLPSTTTARIRPPLPPPLPPSSLPVRTTTTQPLSPLPLPPPLPSSAVGVAAALIPTTLKHRPGSAATSHNLPR